MMECFLVNQIEQSLASMIAGVTDLLEVKLANLYIAEQTMSLLVLILWTKTDYDYGTYANQ